MNSILAKIIESRKGHYCHCIEVSDVYELESVADSICDEFQFTETKETILEFLETLSIYCLDDNNEKEIFDFSFTDYCSDSLN